MNADRLEQMLQDYLDDRLPAEERAAFEARMREDRELSARVEACRRIGSALREAPPELSPGFYTRARARFEAAQRPRRRWFRLVSWESAGLATAVVLVASIFLPPLVRRDLPAVGRAAAPEVRPVAGVRADKVQAKPAARPVDEGRPDEAKSEATTRSLSEVRREEAQTEPAAPEAEEAARAALAREKSAPAAAAGATVTDEVGPQKRNAPAPPPPRPATGDVVESHERRQFAPAPAVAGRDERADLGTAGEPETTAALPRAATSPPPAEVIEGRDNDDSSDLAARNDQPARSTYESRVTGVSHLTPSADAAVDALPVDSYDLPDGVVEAGTVRELTDPRAIAELLGRLGGPAKRAEADSGPTRLVLIGRSTPAFTCRPARLERTGDRYVILLPAASASATPGGGCAVALPDDSLPFFVRVLPDD